MEPTNVRIRMYQMGFGDSVLMSFEYPEPLEDGRAERHMLIDFGSTRYPKSSFKIEKVAEQIATDCNGALDVIVVTHRHKDHLSGFGIKKSRAVIDRLNPKLIVRPWTEDPHAATDATGVNKVDERSLRFTDALNNGQALADELQREFNDKPSGTGLRAELAAVVSHQTSAVPHETGEHDSELPGIEDLTNKSAFDQLTKWGTADGGDQEFLFYGAASKIPTLIPGIKIRVLGPPTVDQHPDVVNARSQDPEYWMLHQNMLVTSLDKTELQPDRRSKISRAETGVPAGPVRWLVRKMQRQHINNLLRIVRDLDDALNNTSLILLIDAGDKRMLFPGDAQIENWRYALKDSTEDNGMSATEVCTLLESVDFYKVSHHGSRNGTPRTLLEGLWSKDDRDLVAVMGTKKKVHGKTERTAVPRETLVDALLERTHQRLYSTASLQVTGEDEATGKTVVAETQVIEVSAKLKGGDPFKLTESDAKPPVADPHTELANH